MAAHEACRNAIAHIEADGLPMSLIDYICPMEGGSSSPLGTTEDRRGVVLVVSTIKRGARESARLPVDRAGSQEPEILS